MRGLCVTPNGTNASSMNRGIGVGTASFGTLGTFILGRGVDVVMINPRSPLIRNVCSCFRKGPRARRVTVVKPAHRKTHLRNDGRFTGRFVRHRGVPATHCGDVATSALRRNFAFLRALRTPCILGTSKLYTKGNILVLPALSRTGGRLGRVLDNVFNGTSTAMIVRRFLDNVRYDMFMLASDRRCGMLPMTGSCGHVNRNSGKLGANNVKDIAPIPFTGSRFVRGMHAHVVRPAMGNLGRRNVLCGNFVFLKLVGMGKRPVIVRCGIHVNSPRARDIVLHIGDSLMRLFRNITRGGLSAGALRVSPHATTYIVLMDNNCPRACRGKFPVANFSRTTTASDVLFRTNAALGSKRMMADNKHIVTVDSCKGAGRRTLTGDCGIARVVRFRGGGLQESVNFSL